MCLLVFKTVTFRMFQNTPKLIRRFYHMDPTLKLLVSEIQYIREKADLLELEVKRLVIENKNLNDSLVGHVDEKVSRILSCEARNLRNTVENYMATPWTIILIVSCILTGAITYFMFHGENCRFCMHS